MTNVIHEKELAQLDASCPGTTIRGAWHSSHLDGISNSMHTCYIAQSTSN